MSLGNSKRWKLPKKNVINSQHTPLGPRIELGLLPSFYDPFDQELVTGSVA
jgi:hypothetical protein